MGAEHGIDPERQSWVERREEEPLGSTEQPHTVIVGGGQGGIALAARLRQVGVPTIIVEKNARPGRLLAQPRWRRAGVAAGGAFTSCQRTAIRRRTRP